LGNGFTERFKSGGGQSIRSPVNAAREEKRREEREVREERREEEEKRPTQNQYRQKGHQTQ
jgi:hypothetical protein